MIPTFTPILPIHKKEETENSSLPLNESPSQKTLEFILNYSKNLQISKSRFVKEVEIVKS